MGLAELFKVIEDSRKLNPIKQNVYNNMLPSKQTKRLTKTPPRTTIDDWMTKLKLTEEDYAMQPTKEPVFSAKIGNLPKLKRRSSPDSARSDLSLFSTSSLGSHGLVNERRHARRRRMARPKHRLEWKTFLQARYILLGELLEKEGMDEDTEKFLKQRKAITQKSTDEVTQSSASSEQSERAPHKFVADKICLSPVAESPTDSDVFPTAADVSLPALNPSGSSISTKAPARHAHDRSCSVCTADRFLPSVSPTSMCYSTPCPSLKHNKDGVPDFERQTTSKVRRRIFMTTYELNRITGYGDPDSMFISSADGDCLRFTDEDYSKIPRIPQRFRVAPQLSRVIRQEIRYKTGRPCYRVLKEKDLRIFEREKSKDMDEGTFKELCIFHWLVDIDEDQFEDVGLEILEEPERPETRASGHRRHSSKQANYTPTLGCDLLDVGIPM